VEVDHILPERYGFMPLAQATKLFSKIDVNNGHKTLETIVLEQILSI